MNAELRDVLELLEKATPGVWVARPDAHGSKNDACIGLHDDDTPIDYIAVSRADCAAAIVAAVNFLRKHGEALSRPVVPEGDGWMPIESAPKDGSSVILGYAGSHSEEGRWVSDESRNHWGETGWFSWDTDVLCEHPSHPTHWRPLPAPPAARSAEEK